MTRCPQADFHLQTSQMQLSYLTCKLLHHMAFLNLFFKLPLGKLCLWCLTPDCIQIHGPWWASCPSELLTRFWREAPSWPWRVECRTSRQTRQANRSPVTKTTLFTKWACNEITKYFNVDDCSYGTTVSSLTSQCTVDGNWALAEPSGQSLASWNLSGANMTSTTVVGSYFRFN